jgi:hypothetical protein
LSGGVPYFLSPFSCCRFLSESGYKLDYDAQAAAAESAFSIPLEQG